MLSQAHRRGAVVFAGSATAWLIGFVVEAWLLMVLLGAAHHQFLAGDGYPWGFWACATVVGVRQAVIWLAAKLWDAGMAHLLRVLYAREPVDREPASRRSR